MKPLYCLSKGDVFWHSHVMWKIVKFDGDDRICRPTSCSETGSTAIFHCDTEVQVYEW